MRDMYRADVINNEITRQKVTKKTSDMVLYMDGDYLKRELLYDQTVYWSRTFRCAKEWLVERAAEGVRVAEAALERAEKYLEDADATCEPS